MRLGVFSWAVLAGLLLVAAGCAQPTTTTTTTEATTSTEAPTTTVADAAGKAAMEKVCSQCHGLRNQQGKNITPEGKGGPRPDMKGKWMLITQGRDWAVVVKKMKETNKCPMTPEEQESISAYMNSVYGKK